ncbi:MAG: sigma-70 family RNA polymerase sigma factor [Synechococcaceae cyanobacterium SM2_3_1]|nr:sigma-70 family RNA polymerase sigma factor [Synechococcaceae cyanobacterium SM2_3_1]
MGFNLSEFPNLQPDATDRELVQLLQAGRSSALTILYKRYSRLVYTLAMRILQNSQEAEDLTQEIFVTFWQKNNFDATRGSLSSYLCLLTRSRALDRKRSEGSYHRFLQRYQRGETSRPRMPFEQVTAEEQQGQMQKALAELPESQRQILHMAYYEGLSQSEIAEQMNLPLGTVKTRSRQGLIKLRRFLDNRL